MPKSKNINIKYTSREFSSIKEDLVDHAKRFYPENYKDFTVPSFGSMVFDSVSYIGDILSYYVDYSVNESFLDTAVEFNNYRFLFYVRPMRKGLHLILNICRH